MSVFRNIMSRIFRGSTLGAQAAPAQGAGEASASPATGQPDPTEAGRSGGMSAQPAPTGSAPPPPAASEPVDVEAVLTGLAAQAPQRLDWRHSIVDLMKLLDLDSSLAARKELAEELGYTGTRDGSAEMNMWLHRAVMRRLAENGGRVPDDLKG